MNEPPGENALRLTRPMLSRLHARRGGARGPAVRTDAAGDAPVLLAEAGVRDASDPAGAAAVAARTAAAVRGRRDSARVYRAFAEHWVVEHGPAFAACAVVQPVLAPAAHEALRRVRGVLAVAGDDEYAEAERSLEPYRETPALRWAVSYLVPTRGDWVDECVASGPGPAGDDRRLMLCSLGDAAHLRDLRPAPPFPEASLDVLVTMADGVGAALAPFLRRVLDAPGGTGPQRRRIFEVLAVLPSDDAFRLLLDHRGDRHARTALVAAVERFPVRARRLSAAEPAPQDVRARDAAPDELPAALTDLPRDRPVRPVVAGLEPPADRRFSWKGGGIDGHVRAEGLQYPEPTGPDWDELRRRHLGRMPRHLRVRFLMHAPEDTVRPLLADWPPEGLEHTGPWPLTLVARYGLDAFPYAWAQAERDPGRDGRLLVPFLDARTAEVMCDRWHNGGWAREWADRHGLDAVPYLAPAALGTDARRRSGAEAALRALAAGHGADAVAGACPEAADELRAVLAAHPAQTGLTPWPEVPAWADPAVLPEVLLRGREAALPPDATRTLVELLALPDPYAVGELRAALDPDSLEEFGLALLERWRSVGEPDDGSWAAAQLARTGGGATVPHLVALIGAASGAGGRRKGCTALDVLVALGSDTALHALYGLAQEAGGGFRDDAAQRFRAAAAARGLTPEHLADRIVPDLGLDAGRGTTLDYGHRRFRAWFDERLRPRFADESGRPRKALPRPGVKDDPDLARAAHRTFAELEKDVLRIVSERSRSLEAAMLAERRWTLGEFRDHLAGHPLVRPLVPRLVWCADAAPFRVAEDGTFADVHDAPFVPPEDAAIGVAHPARLGDDLEAWTNVFADYEILQPFPQLDRPTTDE